MVGRAVGNLRNLKNLRNSTVWHAKRGTNYLAFAVVNHPIFKPGFQNIFQSRFLPVESSVSYPGRVAMSGAVTPDGSAATGYGEKEYWEKRYSLQDDKYEWYLTWDILKKWLLPELKVMEQSNNDDDANCEEMKQTELRRRKDLKTLIVGCGNSELSADMYVDGFTNLLSTDYSEVVVEKMKKKYAANPDILFEVMDIRKMLLEDGVVDVIVDKGTLDAVLCGNDSAKNANEMLMECSRMLKKGGLLLIVTYGKPDSRLTYLKKAKYKWTVKEQALGGKSHYMYTCLKQ